MPTKLKDLRVGLVSIVDRAAVRDPQNKSEPRRLLLWKREGNTTPEGGSMTPEELQAALEKAESERDEARKEAATAQAELEKAAEEKKDEEIGENETTKREEAAAEAASIDKAELPAAVRAAVEKAEAEAAANAAALAEAVAKAESAETLAKAEVERRESAEFIAKAESFEALPMDPSAFGSVLKSIHTKLDKSEVESLETVLKSADAQLRESELFKAFGRETPGAGADAFSEAMGKAAELKKADSGLSDGNALSMVFKNDPELAKRYAAEVR